MNGFEREYIMPWLINASQLDKFRKNQKNVTILDASWHLPTENRDAKEEFLKNHIVGAKFLDLNNFYRKDTTVPHMLLLDTNAINEKVGALGITNEHKIIFYDRSNLHTSCRALWMFQVYGHNTNQLYILDGGYTAWEKYGGKIETGETRLTAKNYKAHIEEKYLRTLAQMKSNLQNPTEQVVDARHPVRYAGGTEIRDNMRPGHIPGSYSFPYFTIFENDGFFKPMDKIRKLLTGIGVEFGHPIISTCGSGITSCVLSFALDLMHHNQHAVYDGSWSEWGFNELYPGETTLEERPVETSLDK